MVGMDRPGVVAAVRNVPRANCRRLIVNIHMAGNSSEEANLFDLEWNSPISVLLIIQRGGIESLAKCVQISSYIEDQVVPNIKSVPSLYESSRQYFKKPTTST